MPRTKASRFLGVHPSSSPHLPWTTQIVIPSGKVATFGSFKTEREAAEAYDRAVLHYRGPGARRNFPDVPLPPADEATLRAEAWRRAKRHASSKYRGVVKKGDRWYARFCVKNRTISLGCWKTDMEAAEACDRAILFLDADRSRLNFPTRHLAPLSPAALRKLAHAPFKRRTTSKYRGVVFAPDFGARPWIAQIGLGKPGGTYKNKHLGTWASEGDAARAYDRAARFYFDERAELNFPEEKLKPAAAVTLMREARRALKLTHSSRYVGVHWSKQAGRWQTIICHHRRLIHLGLFANERAAAEAYDDKSIELRGPLATLNFHPVTGEQIWGTRLRELVGPDRPGALRSASPVNGRR